MTITECAIALVYLTLNIKRTSRAAGPSKNAKDWRRAAAMRLNLQPTCGTNEHEEGEIVR
jgi:hypothetical protein